MFVRLHPPETKFVSLVCVRDRFTPSAESARQFRQFFDNMIFHNLLVACECKDTWDRSYYTQLCANQVGCSNCDNDAYGSWCETVDSECATVQRGSDGVSEGWTYCETPNPTPNPTISGKQLFHRNKVYSNSNRNWLKKRKNCHKARHQSGKIAKNALDSSKSIVSIF